MIMKKLNLWLFLSFFVAAFALSACSSSDSDSTGDNPGGPSYPGNPDNPKYAAYYGVVKNMEGVGISGVKVTAGSFTTTTGYSGVFSFDKVSGKVFTFEAEGYAKVIRAITDDARYDVVMTQAQTESVSTTYPTTLSLDWDGTQVELPTTFKDKNGNPYTGAITASSVYLDPDYDTFANQMPGDLSAIRKDNTEAQLVSYGMVNVELKGANGEELQPDGEATLKFSIPKKFSANPPSEIPLWEFDEATGVWKEEGVAYLQGGYYVGTVTHFSWHNLDQPELRASLSVKVVDANGNAIKDLPVDFDGQREVYTDANGIAKCTVPSKTDMVIRVAPESYGGYALDDNGNVVESKVVKKTIKLDPEKKESITLTMPAKAPVIKGCVVNTGSGSSVATIWIEYSWHKTPVVCTDLNGAFSIYAPISYRGEATLKAKFGDGKIAEQAITLTDADQTINFAVNNDSPAGATIIQVSGPNGLNIKYVMDAPKNGSTYENAVTFQGSSMTVSCSTMDQSEEKEEEMRKGWQFINLQIDNYDASKTDFTASSFSFFNEGNSMSQITAENVPVKVTKSGDVYNFKISNASGKLMDRDRGFDWDNELAVKFSTEFSAK